MSPFNPCAKRGARVRNMDRADTFVAGSRFMYITVDQIMVFRTPPQKNYINKNKNKSAGPLISLITGITNISKVASVRAGQ